MLMQERSHDVPMATAMATTVTMAMAIDLANTMPVAMAMA